VLSAPDLEAQHFTVEETQAPPISFKVGPWIESATLTMSLPPQPPAREATLAWDEAGQTQRRTLFAGGQPPPGGVITVQLHPATLYTVIIEAQDGRRFVGRYDLAPGATRTVNIFFEDAPAAP
jgi:hypothetical protein